MYWTGLAELGASMASRKVRPAAIPPLAPHRWLSSLAVGLVLSLGVAAWSPAQARSPQAEMPAVAVDQLPKEAQATYELIRVGGPFPYDKDGTVFQNRERQLPPKARAYYREYTVKTPGARNRGARRIICGGQPPTAPQACYYTADHYASFSRISSP